MKKIQLINLKKLNFKKIMILISLASAPVLLFTTLDKQNHRDINLNNKSKDTEEEVIKTNDSPLISGDQNDIKDNNVMDEVPTQVPPAEIKSEYKWNGDIANNKYLHYQGKYYTSLDSLRASLGYTKVANGYYDNEKIYYPYTKNELIDHLGVSTVVTKTNEPILIDGNEYKYFKKLSSGNLLNPDYFLKDENIDSMNYESSYKLPETVITYDGKIFNSFSSINDYIELEMIESNKLNTEKIVVDNKEYKYFSDDNESNPTYIPSSAIKGFYNNGRKFNGEIKYLVDGNLFTSNKKISQSALANVIKHDISTSTLSGRYNSVWYNSRQYTLSNSTGKFTTKYREEYQTWIIPPNTSSSNFDPINGPDKVLVTRYRSVTLELPDWSWYLSRANNRINLSNNPKDSYTYNHLNYLMKINAQDYCQLNNIEDILIDGVLFHNYFMSSNENPSFIEATLGTPGFYNNQRILNSVPLYRGAGKYWTSKEKMYETLNVAETKLIDLTSHQNKEQINLWIDKSNYFKFVFKNMYVGKDLLNPGYFKNQPTSQIAEPYDLNNIKIIDGNKNYSDIDSYFNSEGYHKVSEGYVSHNSYYEVPELKFPIENDSTIPEPTLNTIVFIDDVKYSTSIIKSDI